MTTPEKTIHVEPEGKQVTLTLYVSPHPKEEYLSKWKEFATAADVIAQAWADFKKEHPGPSTDNYEDFAKWHSTGSSVVQAKCQNEYKKYADIPSSIDADKNGLFAELAGDFTELMYRLRSEVLVGEIEENLRIADDVYKKNPNHPEGSTTGMDIENDRLFLTELREKLSRSRADADILEALEWLETGFSTGGVAGTGRIGKPIKELDKTTKFVFDDFSGKVGGTCFHSSRKNDHRDGFFDILEQAVKGEYPVGDDVYRAQMMRNGWKAYPTYNIDVDMYGALKGKYCLNKSSQMLPKDCDTKNGNAQLWLSPVEIKITLPERYSPIVERTFEKIKARYEDRIVPAEDLKEWKR